jgi:Tfp pilus assembly protein PilN
LALPVDGKRIRATHGLSLQTLIDLAQDPLIVATMVLAVGAGLGGLYLDTTASNQVLQLRQQIATAQQDSLRLSRDLQQAERLRQTRAKAAEELQAVAAVDRNRFALPRLLDRLSRELVENMWVTSLGTERPDPATNDIGWVVTGYAPSRSLVARYLDRLAAAENIGVVVTDSIREEQRNGIPIIAFQLQGRTRLPDSSRLTFVPLGQTSPAQRALAGSDGVESLWDKLGDPPVDGPERAEATSDPRDSLVMGASPSPRGLPALPTASSPSAPSRTPPAGPSRPPER